MVATSEAQPCFEPPPEFDDYRIAGRLGRGASGDVFVAEDVVLARQVAIKFIGAEPEPRARQQFLVEARAAARVQHPNVVGIFRVGELADRPYLVSELVRGRPLADLVATGALAADRVLALAIDIARGLGAAHRRGVVHADLKPANVIVTDEGVARLVDFGLARILREGHDEVGAAAVPIGTPDYMAPELWQGHVPTRRSDVFAAGAVIFELASGAPPFAGLAAEHLARRADAPALPGDPRLAEIVARCLARDPAARFASGDELRAALERLAQARQPTAGDANPYRGLRAFEAAHRGMFFGRGAEVSEIVDRLRTDSVVVIAGDSGVGKSSIVRAGVLPALVDDGRGDTRRTWRAITLVPGRHPLHAFATALGIPALAERLRDDPGALARDLHASAGKDGGIVLFVDQLEELATIGDPDEVRAIDAALAALASGAAAHLRLVATVRADFVGHLAALPRFGDALARALYFVRALPPERIRDVVVGPAEVSGARFESEAMVAALVEATADAGGGGLPLLSFTLAELWEARDRDRGVITQEVLDAMGGVAGALAGHADTVVARLPAAERALARTILVRMVTTHGTRVRRLRGELPPDPTTDAALAALVRGRLVVAHEVEGTATYEIAHEVLVRGWATLQAWLADDAGRRGTHERLTAAAGEWQRLGRRRDALWIGARLAEAMALPTASLADTERAFLAAAQHARRRRWWIRRAAIAGVVGLVALAVAIQHVRGVRALADEVDDALADAGPTLAQARASEVARSTAARAAFAAFDAGDATAGEASWRDARTTGRGASATYRTAAREIEAALARDGTRDDVRDLLGDVLVERIELAERLGESDLREELAGRVGAYDRDGSRRARLAAPGRIAVATTARTIEIDGAAHPATEAPFALAPGVHVLAVRAGAAVATLPVLVERGVDRTVSLAPPARPAPAGYVYVPPGTFLYGSDDDDDTRTTFLSTAPLHARETAGYLIGIDEVTIGDWLAYVDAQPAGDRAGRVPHIDLASGTAGVALDRDPRDRWRLTIQTVGHTYRAAIGEPLAYPGRDRRAEQAWLRLPMLGVSARDVEAYATWLAASGALPGARLCTELEWERAARGADARDTPSGRPLGPDDANLDDTYGHDLLGPDAVGSHPASRSPFGIDDLAGNAFEWTRGERAGEYVERGGSFYHDRKTASIPNRNPGSPDLRDATLGARVCAAWN